MPRANKRICSGIGCASIIPAGFSKCDEHQREYERKRGSSSERGYGAEHRAERSRLAPLVASGRAVCNRCAGPVIPGTPWALDHDDARTGYRGVAHKHCNDAAGGRAAHRR